MQAYRISERGFHVGPGALMLISAAQAADRAHKVEVVEKPKKDAAFVLVKAKEVQHFKAGELLGLMGMPKGMAHMAAAVENRKKGPEAALISACADIKAAAEQAELDAMLKREEEEKKRAAEQAAAAEKAQVAAWSAEYQTNEAIKAKYPAVADYIAMRRTESAKA